MVKFRSGWGTVRVFHGNIIFGFTNALRFITRKLTRVLPRFYQKIIFAVCVFLYLTDFYNLSSDNDRKVESFTVAEAVRVSDPKGFLLTQTSGVTVNTLPGAIKSDGKTFDPESGSSEKRSSNVLPGAIGLTGSFDSNGDGSKPPAAEEEKKQGTHSIKKPSLSDKTGGKGRKSAKTKSRKTKTATEAPSVGASSKPDSTPLTSGSTRRKKKWTRGKKGLKKKGLTKKRKRKKTISAPSRKKKEAVSKPSATGEKPVKSKSSGKAEGSSSGSKKAKSSAAGESSGKDSPKDSSASESKAPGSSGEPLYKGPHPMNRNMEELQVDGGIGTLDEPAIKKVYGKLVKAYLAPFSDGIKRRSFFEVLRRKTYSLTPPGANKGIQTILFQIIDSSTYLSHLHLPIPFSFVTTDFFPFIFSWGNRAIYDGPV